MICLEIKVNASPTKDSKIYRNSGKTKCDNHKIYIMLFENSKIRARPDKYFASPPDGTIIAREIYYRVIYSRRLLLSNSV